MQGQRVLITGASAGIGAALARAYAQRAARLVLVARREDKLRAVAQEVGGITCIADVTHADALVRAATMAEEQLGGLDVVIANAGFAVAGRFDELTSEDYRRQFETNVFGVLATIRACLPLLTASHGRIAIIGSLAGTVAAPGTSAYSMSKAALRPLAEILRMELEKTGVSVTLVTPGIICSDIRRTDNTGVFHPDRNDRAPSWLAMPTQQAARAMMRAIDQRRREAIISTHASLVLGLWRWCPWVVRPFLARQRSWNSREDSAKND